MAIQLNKAYFSRNKTRQKESYGFFNFTSDDLNFLLKLLITIFFTPVIISSSLLSKEFFLIIGNLSISLGYVSNFIFQIIIGDISGSEIAISSTALSIAVLQAYIIFPPLATLSIINFILTANYVASTINAYFLIKNIIIPPIKHMIDTSLTWFGFNTGASYFNRSLFTFKQDQFVLDRLLRVHYGHDSYSNKYKDDHIKPFNNLLLKLMSYINKYERPFLGYVKNREEIITLEKQINDLTIQGNTVSAYTFIRKKIDFKKTKLGLLVRAEEELSDPQANKTARSALRFFDKYNSDRDLLDASLLSEARQCLKQEIYRQNVKLIALEECVVHKG